MENEIAGGGQNLAAADPENRNKYGDELLPNVSTRESHNSTLRELSSDDHVVGITAFPCEQVA